MPLTPSANRVLARFPGLGLMSVARPAARPLARPGRGVAGPGQTEKTGTRPLPPGMRPAEPVASALPCDAEAVPRRGPEQGQNGPQQEPIKRQW
jgi:hypothetical protein